MARLKRWAPGRVPAAARSVSDTNDVVQDAALRVWKRMAHLDLRKPGDLDAYVRQAVINRIRDQARRGLVHPPSLSLDLDVIDNVPSVLDHMLTTEQMERCQRAFAALDVSDREAVIARLDMGYSFEQIAELTNRPSAAAARMAVHRAIDKMRRAVHAPPEAAH